MQPPLRRFYVRLGPYLLFLIVFLSIATPKGLAWLLPCLAAFAALVFPGKGVSLIELKHDVPAGALFGAITGYLLLGILWSADKGSAIAAGLIFLLYATSFALLINGLKRETPTVVQGLSRIVPAGVAAGALYILFELSTDNLLQRSIFSHIPLTRPASPEHVGMSDGQVAFWAIDELNPGVAVLNMLAWPAAFAISHGPASTLVWLKRAALMVLVAAATFLSEHDASKIALLCAMLIFAVSWTSPRWATLLVGAAFIGACLAAVPLVQAAYRDGWHLSTAISVNGRARLIIWDATAAKVRDHPLLGIGANNTKAATSQVSAQQRPDHVIAWATGNHAHNVFLQTWYELGATGVALLAMVALMVLSGIARMPRDGAPYALAVFASVTIINSLSWSLWYPWVLASLFLASFFVLLVNAAAQNRAWTDELAVSD